MIQAWSEAEQDPAERERRLDASVARLRAMLARSDERQACRLREAACTGGHEWDWRAGRKPGLRVGICRRCGETRFWQRPKAKGA